MSPFVFLALLVLAQEPAAPSTRAILERDPRTLPVAEEGRWHGWSPAAALPSELGQAQRRITLESARNDVPAALEAVYAALDLAPDWPPGLHQLGVLYFKLQRYGDARVAFERFLAVAPGLVGQTRGLGHALYSLGEWEAAREHYRRVLEAVPGDVDARFGLALCELRRGAAERALAGFEEVLAAQPDHADAAIWRAQVLFEQGLLDDAAQAAGRARDLEPFEPRPWFLLARVLFELGRDEEAAQAQARFGVLDRAAQLARRLEHDLEYAPEDLGRLARLAEVRADVGDFRRARRTLALMLLVAPRDLELRLWQIDLLEAAGDEEGARVAALALEEALPEQALTWERLARFWGRRGDRARQVQAGERYLRLSGLQPEPGGGLAPKVLPPR